MIKKIPGQVESGTSDLEHRGYVEGDQEIPNKDFEGLEGTRELAQGHGERIEPQQEAITSGAESAVQTGRTVSNAEVLEGSAGDQGPDAVELLRTLHEGRFYDTETKSSKKADEEVRRALGL